MNKVLTNIIEKVQKLLSLANSPDENEAKSATAKANALLLKYNLSLQEIEDHQRDYTVKDIADSGLTLKPHHNQIADLLSEFFFVKIHISRVFSGLSSGKYSYRNGPRPQYKKIIQLVGSKENVEIAGYIFSYLDPLYPKLWKDKYERNAKLKPSDRVAYYMGLTKGISQLLEETKWKVQEETGLVLVDDPGLVKYSEDITNGKSYGSGSSAQVDRDVYAEGVQDGKKITLRKPIEGTSVNSNKQLGGKS